MFDNKDLIAQNVKDSVTELMAGYGYEIITTLITDIELPKDVERSMNAINSAQRDQEAARALAGAERTKTVVAAKAQAEAMEQTGIGIANQRKAIADGIAASLDTIKSSGVTAQEANVAVPVHPVGRNDELVRRVGQMVHRGAAQLLRQQVLNSARPARGSANREGLGGIADA